jgi:hypothetical protein
MIEGAEACEIQSLTNTVFSARRLRRVLIYLSECVRVDWRPEHG